MRSGHTGHEPRSAYAGATIGRREILVAGGLGLMTGATRQASAASSGQLTWGVHVSLAPAWFEPAEVSGIITPFTSMSGERAARQLVEACVAGRAHVTPAVQFRLVEMGHSVAPELAAAVTSLVARQLPSPPSGEDGRQRRSTREVGFGWMTPLLPNAAARRNNESY